MGGLTGDCIGGVLAECNGVLVPDADDGRDMGNGWVACPVENDGANPAGMGEAEAFGSDGIDAGGNCGLIVSAAVGLAKNTRVSLRNVLESLVRWYSSWMDNALG